MANYGLFFGWDRPVPGREGLAAELFTEVLGYWTKQKAAGHCESFEPVLLNRHGGDLNGLLLVRGTMEKLEPLTMTDEYESLITKSDHILQRFGVTGASVGDGIQDAMALWAKLIPR
jgi:hypothetical protein